MVEHGQLDSFAGFLSLDIIFCLKVAIRSNVRDLDSILRQNMTYKQPPMAIARISLTAHYGNSVILDTFFQSANSFNELR
tara:strand:- start:35 stop:274 length:240 start_codon:yes stop_codon:yes gene_type:complete